MKQRSIILSILLPLLAGGCGSTRSSGVPIEESGFLANYSLLHETDSTIFGDTGPRPKRRYVNPDANWKSYDKIVVDPVILFRSEDVESPQGAQELLNYFCAELREELGRDYEVVQSPGSRTLRFTVAFTRFGKRNVTLDKFSTYVPFSRAIAEVEGLIRGKPSFVGYAQVEAKFTDAETGELLLAAMDKRVGGKTFKDFDSWSDVRAAMDYWAQLVVFRLCLLRGDSDCKSP
jgi:hypothetical protein